MWLIKNIVVKIFLFLLGTIAVFISCTNLFKLNYNAALAINNVTKRTAKLNFISIQSGDWRRLGNLMFNYAALLGIAKKNNMIPVLKLDSQETELFNIFHISIKNCSKNFFLTLPNKTHFREIAPVKYDPRTNDLRQLNTELLGSFESYKYFEDIDIHKLLRRDFVFKEKYLSVARTKLQRKILSLNASLNYLLVGMHVRRGDFVKLSWAGFGPPNKEYFHAAMRNMKTLKKKEIIWVVSSDDILWCKQNLNFTSKKVVFTNTSSYVIDLAMLSLCDNMIISAGSYSWWAAWLVNGTTIFYKNWPRPGSSLYGRFSYADYYPSHWIPM